MGVSKLAGLVVLGAVAIHGIPTAFAQAPAPTVLEAQVQDALQNCDQCHGPGGVSVIPSHPTIAGQKAEYVRRQLMAFKRAISDAPAGADGDADNANSTVRSDPVMQHMASGLPDHLIGPVAETISQLACDGNVSKVPPAKTRTPPDAVAPCVMCHGVDGIGVQTYIPNLAGQQRSYLRRQLLLIRETAWGAKPREGEAWRSHPIMEAQAARLKIADIDAIARYYTSLNCRGAGTE